MQEGAVQQVFRRFMCLPQNMRRGQLSPDRSAAITPSSITPRAVCTFVFK